MAHADFVHLRVHSAYSLLEGALKIPELAALCRRHAMPAVAVTDTRNLFGALEFSLAMKAAGVQPIVGCEFPVSREGGEAQGNGAAARGPEPDVLVLLVKDEVGYANLIGLVSEAHLATEPGRTPQLAWERLAGRTEGLIALTAGPEGTVGRLLLENRPAEAEAALERSKALFPGRLYVEVMRHGLAAEEEIEGALIDLAYAHELPLVATNAAYFADEDMFEAHDALLAIAAGAHVGDADRRRLTPNHRFRSPAEMKALFADLPEAVANTLVVARRCAFAAPEHAPILPPFPDAVGKGEGETLREEARRGLEARLAAHVFTESMDAAAREEAERPYRERLTYELGVIEAMGFPGYFLIVADFIRWAKGRGIPVGPGRGSGAGSVVSWALTITDLDPLRFNLLFERFLNPERISMPDFDVDFCQDRRDEVIRYVQEKYGTDRVAQIITFGKLQARAVLRDVGRVLGMPYGQVDRICKLVPYNPANPVSLKDAIDDEPLLQRMRAEDETVARLMDIALRLEGLYRHASTHAAGVVIGDRPLSRLVPLYRDPRSEMPVTQFNMKYVELAGLVKFDFLGLKTLTVLARARDLVSETEGIAVDLATLPLDDEATFVMLARGDTTGVFQLESSGMRDVLRNLRPDTFEDIIALVALYRPGPMDNIPRYIACKHRREEPDYLHPSLEGILKETFGVMIYQEQVMQIAQELSGYSLGGADILRRAMGKKIRSEMDEQRGAFVDGAVARGVERGTAEHIFEQVNKFAEYGFNKSHAAAYALIAYQTAWFKANYPVEFLAASMTLDMGNTDKLNVFRQELDRMGVALLPPDVNASGAAFTVERRGGEAKAIRYALGAIKGVGAAAMSALVAEREAHGPFTDLLDFASRCDGKVAHKRQLESLAAAGSFDSLMPDRACVLANVELLVQRAQTAASERASGQGSLFGGPGPAADGAGLVPAEPWSEMEKLHHEFEAIGFYLSAHPLDAYGSRLERLYVLPSARLASRATGSDAGRVKLAGTVISRRERTSAGNRRFAFVQMSDPSGMYEVTVFSEVLSRARDLLEAGRNVLVTVEVRREGEGMRLTAQDVTSLDEAVAHAAPGLKVAVSEPGALARVREIIAAVPRGRGEVSLVLGLGTAGEVELALPGRFAVPAGAVQDLRAVPGIAEVREI